MKGIIGLEKPYKGTVRFDGTDVVGRSPHENVRSGMFYLSAQNAYFPDISIRTNLELAANIVTDSEVIGQRIVEILKLFPILGDRLDQKAKNLSGGQKKMLEIGMAMMTRPKLFLIDEPSLGFSPLLVEQVMACMQDIRKNYGTAILLVEQNVEQALRIADRAYIMKIGEIIAADKAENLRNRGHELFTLF